MSAKAKSWTSFAIIFAFILGIIAWVKWDAWSRDPIQILYWWLEIAALIAISLLFAPLIFRGLKGVMWVYVLIGTFLARLFLGNRAAVAAEKGESREEFLRKPLFKGYISWMRFGDDRDHVDRALTPEKAASWIIFGWPLAVLPLIFEETLPFYLFLLGLAPVLIRLHDRRRKEVHDAMAKAFPKEISDPQSQT